jgi:DNA polymerase-3 subunit epsilon
MGIFSRKSKNGVSNVTVEEDWPFDDQPGFVVFDIETTGLSPTSDRMIEIGLIRTDNLGNPLAYWSSLINPQQAVTATEIHGISDKDVANSPTFEDVLDQVLPRIRGQALAAHNAEFDISFLKVELARVGWDLPRTPVLCTMEESQYFIPGLSRRRLQDCIDALGIDQAVEHRALGDASLATALVNFYLNGPTNRKRSNELIDLPNIAKSVTWPTSQTFPKIPKSSSNQKQWVTKRPSNSALMKTISSMMPEDLLGENASKSELTYAQVLLEAMEDGIISEQENSSLSDLSNSLQIATETQTAIHKKLMQTIAQEAWKDGSVSKAEQSEVVEAGKSLGFSDNDSKNFIKEIEELRASRISARAKELPTDWDLGDPLRVGDRVVITGCYEAGRDELETKSKMLGIRITGSVSGKTNLLVSDGTINGIKDAEAAKLGIRSVTPDEYRKLLDYIQPSEPKESATADTGLNTIRETLVCTKCAETFTREATKGRKPHHCLKCR